MHETKVGFKATAWALALIAFGVSAQEAPAPGATASPANAPGEAAPTEGDAAAAESAATEQPETAGVEEIIVTAQRKRERLQDVPIAVNVLSQDALESRGLTTTQDLQAAVPGLEFKSSGAGGTPFLRGVGSNAANPNDEPSVATYVDGVYIAAPAANVMGLGNIERVEVLKGPQGTLFGRNATGGVIQIVTRDPKQEKALEVAGGYANYKTGSGSVYATGGLTDDLAADVSAQAERQDKGWGKNVTRDQETYEHRNFGARTKWLYTPSDALSFRLAADHYESNSTQYEYRLPKGVLGIDGQPSPSDEYDTASNIVLDGIGASRVISRQTGVSLRSDYQLPSMQLVSLSSWRHHRGTYQAEADATPDQWVDAHLPLYQRSFAQEFQLISGKEQRLDWVAGAYLYWNKASYEDGVFEGLAFGSPPGSAVGRFEVDGIQKTDSQSVYAQGTLEVIEKTKLTTGLRFTHENQELTSRVFDTPVPSPDDRGFDKLTWRVALDRAFADEVHGYASYNRGVKGGGFDLLTPGGEGFDPEILDAYELGLKSTLLDGTLRLNIALFYYDYKDIQVQIINTDAGGTARTTNAAAATIQGLDVDFQYVPIANLTFSGGFVVMDGEYDDFEDTISYQESPLDGPSTVIDASGNDTIQTPDFAGNVAVDYRIQSSLGEFPLSIMFSHNSGYYFGADNRMEQDAYDLLNAAAGWNSRDDRYGVTFWGRNLTGEYYYTQGIPSGLGDLTTPAAPRTYGVTFRMNF